jgi:hypothetical protein
MVRIEQKVLKDIWFCFERLLLKGVFQIMGLFSDICGNKY